MLDEFEDMSASDATVADFIAFTGANSDEAKQYLEMAGGQLEQAVNLFMEMGGGGMGGAPPAAAAPPARPMGGGGPAAMDGVIDADVAAEVAAMAAAAGISVDQPMDAEPEVRAPIAEFNDQIINTGDAERERRRQQALIQADAAAMDRRMSFDRADDADGAAAGGDAKGDNKNGNTDAPAGGKAINQLFKAPSFNNPEPYYQAIEKAKGEAKWVLVNIQQSEVFASHTLNRDVWSDETIKDIIEGSFIFWQRDDKSTEGVQFIQYHNCGHQLPHICVIDPRTGRKIKSWDGKKWADVSVAVEFLMSFLDSNDLTKSPNMSPAMSPDMSPQAAPAGTDLTMTGLDDVDMGGGAATAEPAPAPEPEAPKEPAAAMPDEPPEGPECAKVALRLPSGQLRRRILKTAPISELFAVASASTETPVNRLDLATTFPKRNLRDLPGGLDCLVKDAEVNGSQVMVTIRPA